MKLALCNEMFGDLSFAEVCQTTRELGYHGLELAPFTLAPPERLDATHRKPGTPLVEPSRVAEIRATIADAGLEVVGLHWLYAKTTGLHVTTADNATWERTVDYTRALIDLCGDLGGDVMVFGSPQQRSLEPGRTFEDAWARARALFEAVLPLAEERGVTLCVEPLGPNETDFINTVAEGVKLAREIDHPRMKVHLDIKAMASEGRPIADTIRATDLADIGHFHVNDPNLYGPGMGDVDFEPITDAIRAVGWDCWLSVEVFKYDPDSETVARKSMECLKQIGF